MKNIIWVTIDSIRADHTTICGYKRNTTPRLQEIADNSEATNFTKCIAQSNWTAPATASILSGTLPSTHGVGIEDTGQLPSDIQTLPELLSENGYRTACLSPNPYVSPATGLDKGFDEFTWFSPFRNKFLFFKYFSPLCKYAIRLRSYGPGFSTNRKRHNFTYTLVEAAKRWLANASTGSDPFFLYLHLQNPHLPYTPPREFHDSFIDTTSLSIDEALNLSLSLYGGDIYEQIASGLDLSDAEWSGLKALYDGEIRYADDRIGELFDLVKNLDESVMIVTADHGDLFGENGLLGHGDLLHDGLIHVPMIVYGLDDIDNNAENPVQHIDFTRTIAEVTNCATSEMEGRDLRFTACDYAFSQAHVSDYDDLRKRNPDFDVIPYSGDCTAIRTSNMKYIRGSNSSALFQLPDELQDTSHDNSDEVKKFNNIIEKNVNWKYISSRPATFTEAKKSQLRDLGYYE